MDGAPPPRRELLLAGVGLGFGLGGFFDGILLHQILQWHHLLSGISKASQDIRVLIMADGLFHALMYIVTATSMWLLWRARRDWSMPGGDRSLTGLALIGFGAWHILDAFLSHWLLGIHRIRMDTDVPLLWDLLWLAVFGILPAVSGRLLQTRRPTSHRLLTSPIVLVLSVLIAAPMAAMPDPRQTAAIVVFRTGMSPGEAAAAIGNVGASIVWADPANQIWAVDFSNGGEPNRLYREGALMVSTSFLAAGCAGWVKL